jgi:uncharacterized phiE125 gp8 family phage protein
VLAQPGRPVGGIELDVRVGYGDTAASVPEPLRQAIRLLVAHWYENRLPTQQAGALPASITALIAPFRALGL